MGRPDGAERRHARRQIRPGQEPHLRHRLPGAGAALPDAEGARPPRRPQHRGLRHRLPRLAARRPRPAVPSAPQRSLDRYDIRFQAGINEDLAATALWGSQQAELRGEGKFDGVFGMWYGKGPGVDRTGDVFRHANFAGTSRHGGVLALMGDDHTAESSTTAHQSEYPLHRRDDPDPQPGRGAGDPRLRPLRLGDVALHAAPGWRSNACTRRWRSTAVIDGSLERVNIVIPDDFPMPEGGLNIRLRDTILGQEARLHDYKRDAMLAFVRANKLNKHHHLGRPQARRSASSRSARAISTCARRSTSSASTRSSATISACASTRSAARGRSASASSRSSPRASSSIIVVEEKRSLHRGAGARGALRHRQPAGLHRQEGRAGQLAVPGQGRARSQRRRDLHRRAPAASIGRNEEIAGARRAAQGGAARRWPRRRTSRCACPISAPAARTIPRPWCRRACAPMPASAATTWRSGWTARRSATPRWAARAPTGSARRRSPSAPHVFQNLGDGTYNHSGYMAIRAAIAVRRQHHLQDPVQRRGRDDRRPGQRRRAHRAADRAPGRRRRRQARRRRHRRAVRNIPPATDWPSGLTIHHRDDLDDGADASSPRSPAARC